MDFEAVSVFHEPITESIFQNQSGRSVFLTIGVVLKNRENLDIGIMTASGTNFQVCHFETLTVVSYTLESGDTIQARHSDGAEAWIKMSIQT